MKERIKLEKANKTGDKAAKEGQQKRKNQKDAVGPKKRKKPETDDKAETDREKDKKAKEKEDKRKKKEEEQRRKDFLLEAKKAQAAERWSSSSLDAANFTPEPLRRASNQAPTPHAPVQLHVTTPAEPTCTIPDPHATPSQLIDPASCRTPASHTTPRSSCRTPASGTTLSPHTANPPARRQATTPQTGVISSRASELRRGIHFQSPVDDSSDDEHSEESDADTDYSTRLTDEVGSCGSCCKEQKIENEALRKRLEKVHRRLNIACKSSSPIH